MKQSVKLPDDLESTVSTLSSAFDIFVDFLENRLLIALTRERAELKRDDLMALNEQLPVKAAHVHSRSTQESFPMINFFFHVAVAARLVQISLEEKGVYLRIVEDRLEQYQLLNPLEKYFFLLESLWVNMNWDLIDKEHTLEQVITYKSFEQLSKFDTQWKELSQENPWAHLDRLSKELSQVNEGIHQNLIIGKIGAFFELMGFWKTAPDSPLTSKKRPVITKLMVTPLGKWMMEILVGKRPLSEWNDPYRKMLGLWGIPPGVDEELFYEKGHKMLEEEGVPVFIDAFTPFFDNYELRRTLPPLYTGFVGGTYLFKVAVSPDIYRTIAISANDTLEDLHLAIQKAYKFDNDHLYAFYMDGREGSALSINSPHDEPPCADEYQIGSLGLVEGQQILYLFDFGDNWIFLITVQEVKSEVPMHGKPKVVEKKGNAPEQYAYSDEDLDDE